MGRRSLARVDQTFYFPHRRIVSPLSGSVGIRTDSDVRVESFDRKLRAAEAEVGQAAEAAAEAKLCLGNASKKNDW